MCVVCCGLLRRLSLLLPIIWNNSVTHIFTSNPLSYFPPPLYTPPNTAKLWRRPKVRLCLSVYVCALSVYCACPTRVPPFVITSIHTKNKNTGFDIMGSHHAQHLSYTHIHDVCMYNITHATDTFIATTPLILSPNQLKNTKTQPIFRLPPSPLVRPQAF